jgi:predicted RNA-binding Zn-ribbon protein involved in translation (DUF1610 family)
LYQFFVFFSPIVSQNAESRKKKKKPKKRLICKPQKKEKKKVMPASSSPSKKVPGEALTDLLRDGLLNDFSQRPPVTPPRFSSPAPATPGTPTTAGAALADMLDTARRMHPRRAEAEPLTPSAVDGMIRGFFSALGRDASGARVTPTRTSSTGGGRGSSATPATPGASENDFFYSPAAPSSSSVPQATRLHAVGPSALASASLGEFTTELSPGLAAWEAELAQRAEERKRADERARAEAAVVARASPSHAELEKESQLAAAALAEATERVRAARLGDESKPLSSSTLGSSSSFSSSVGASSSSLAELEAAAAILTERSKAALAREREQRDRDARGASSAAEALLCFVCNASLAVAGDPVTFPCGHTGCGACYRDLADRASASHVAVACPDCGRVVTGGGLEVNQALKAALFAMAAQVVQDGGGSGGGSGGGFGGGFGGIGGGNTAGASGAASPASQFLKNVHPSSSSSSLSSSLPSSSSSSSSSQLQLAHASGALTPFGRTRLAIPREELVVTHEVLGEGAFGAVHVGKLGNRRVAVKRLLPRNLVGPDRGKMRRSVEREMAVMALIGGHPSVLGMLGFVEDDGFQGPLVVSELMDGGTLHGFIAMHRSSEAWAVRPRSSVPRAVYLRILRQVLAGLAHLHAHGYAHRDLRPANVLLTSPHPEDMAAKISDFGLAKRVCASAGAPGAGAAAESSFGRGADWYVAPEMLGNVAFSDFAVDMFGFGLLCLELLTGERPFRAYDRIEPLIADYVRDPEAAPQPGLFPEDTPPEIVGIALQCWRREPGSRPTARDALARLPPC